jgi:hypothetical protein
MIAPDWLRLRETFCPLTVPETFCPVPVPVTEPTPAQFEFEARRKLPVTELLDWLKKPVKTTGVVASRVTCQLPETKPLGDATLRPLPHAIAGINTPSNKMTDKSLTPFSTNSRSGALTRTRHLTQLIRFK